MIWNKLGNGFKGDKAYGIWVGQDSEGRNVYRVQRSPIIPQGEAGYYNLNSHLKLIGVTMDTVVI